VVFERKIKVLDKGCSVLGETYDTVFSLYITFFVNEILRSLALF
jgi:hypothetical protein